MSNHVDSAFDANVFEAAHSLARSGAFERIVELPDAVSVLQSATGMTGSQPMALSA